LLRRALAIDERSFPRGHLRVGLDLKHAGTIAANQKRFREAVELFQRSLEVLRGALPANHPELGSALAEFAGVHASAKNYGEAISLYSQALPILTASWGAEDRRLLPYLDAYAAMLRIERDFVGAAQADLQATRIRVIRALR
jgi:tetratricopeptide (TPR) repeat protein